MNGKQQKIIERLEFVLKDFAEEWLSQKLVCKDDITAKEFARELARKVETMPIGIVYEILGLRSVKTILHIPYSRKPSIN